MKHIAKAQRIVRTGDATTAYEYKIGSSIINAAVIDIAGRYPTDGWARNMKSTSLIYIISGEGSIVVDGLEKVLHTGDQLLIEVGERYMFEGVLQILYGATPAWTPEQSEHVHD